MATRIEAIPSTLYERDVHAWSLEQAALLRARRFADLDLDNLAREVEEVAASLYRDVRSRVRTIMKHLLKLQYLPATDPRPGWERTVRTRRADLAEDLTASLRPRIEASLEPFDETARMEAATALREHGEHAAAAALPATCPYTLDQITGDWWP